MRPNSRLLPKLYATRNYCIIKGNYLPNMPALMASWQEQRSECPVPRCTGGCPVSTGLHDSLACRAVAVGEAPSQPSSAPALMLPHRTRPPHDQPPTLRAGFGAAFQSCKGCDPGPAARYAASQSLPAMTGADNDGQEASRPERRGRRHHAAVAVQPGATPSSQQIKHDRPRAMSHLESAARPHTRPSPWPDQARP